MTFLELCQRLRQEVGAAGNGPNTVVKQAGEMARLVSWVQRAWEDIQLERSDWYFNWATGEVEVFADFREYELPDDFLRWKPDTLRMEGEEVKIITWNAFNDKYREPDNGAPLTVAIAPNRILHLSRYPKVSSGRLTFEYFRTPQVLIGNNDKPRLPQEYQMAIIYRAMLMYGFYENAPEVIQQAQMLYGQIMQRMVGQELPSIELGGPLA